MYTKQLEQQTSFATNQRKSLINWFNKQNIDMQVDIFKEQRNQFFAHKNKYGLSDITALAAFCKAIDIYYQKNKILLQKNKSASLKEFNNITEFSIKKYRKQRFSAKREKLLNLSSVIKNLIDEGYSFRELSKYLYKVHRLEVSHTYIQKIHKEITNV